MVFMVTTELRIGGWAVYRSGIGAGEEAVKLVGEVVECRVGNMQRIYCKINAIRFMSHYFAFPLRALH